MKKIVITCFFVSFCLPVFSQISEAIADSLVQRIAKSYLYHPEAELGKSGIVYLYIAKEADSVFVSTKFTSYQTGWDSQVIKYASGLNRVKRSLPNKYAVVLPVRFNCIKNGKPTSVTLTKAERKKVKASLKGMRSLRPMVEEYTVTTIPAHNTSGCCTTPQLSDLYVSKAFTLGYLAGIFR